MDKQTEGLLGCIAVPAAIALVLFAVWPERDPEQDKAAHARQQIATAQERVKAELRDPGSAVFSDIYVPHPGVWTVCGRVNSRNGFGGMSGPQRFVVGREEVFLEERQEAVIPGHFDGFWQQMCG